MEFPDSHVKVLTRVKFFDHHLIMITPVPGDHNRVARKFKFESAWLMDDSYHDILKTMRRNEHNLNIKGQHVKEDIK